MRVLILATFISFSVIALAQELPPGTYRGTRLCSDGSIPADRLSQYPIFLSLGADHAYTTLADLYKMDENVCSEVKSGTLQLINNTQVASTKKYDRCGECGNFDPTRSPIEEKANVELTSNGFLLRVYPEFGVGGACRPGQYLIVNFQRVRDYLENIKLECKAVEGF